MPIAKVYNNIFLSRYDDADIFTRTSANFLVIIGLVFFTVMFGLFFLNLPTVGLVKSLVSSGLSCLTASITIILVVRGKVWVADEIGKLADSSSSELKKIKDLVNTNKSDVEYSSSIIKNIIHFIESLNKSLATAQGKAMETMTVISRQKELQGAMLHGTGEVHENSEFIRSSSSEQTIAIQEIAKSIDNTNGMIQANNADAVVLMESYERLKSLALDLRKVMFVE